MSMIRLGFSVITFGITYGIAFLLTPILIGAFFSSFNPTDIHSNSDWLGMYNTHVDTLQYLIPLVPSFALFIFVTKVLMTASAYGRD